MAELPLDDGVARFKANEDRFDQFVNNATGYTSSGGVSVESVREFLARIEQTIAAYGTLVGFATKALLDADLAHAEGTMAYVTNDTTTANNGYYIKSGASGAGSWTRSDYDPLNQLRADFDAIAAALDTLGLDSMANFFPNGNFELENGVYIDPSLTWNGADTGNLVHSDLSSVSALAAMGINYGWKTTAGVDANYHLLMPIPSGLGGQYFLASFITYSPNGIADDHGDDQIYVGKNGALGDGNNGISSVTRTHVDIDATIRVHYISFKLFDTYDSADLWIGSTGIGGTESVYLTGYNATWSPKAMPTLGATSYNDFSPNQIQEDLRQAQNDIVTLFATKTDVEVPLATVTVNAVTDKYATRSTVPDKHAVSNPELGAVLEYPYDEWAYNATGEPNVMVAKMTTSSRYLPFVCVNILPEDLASIGVVPDDTTPPTVSFRGGHLYKGANQVWSSQQIFFCLQYSDDPFTENYNAGRDVLFVNGTGTPNASYLGAGDSLWTHTGATAAKTDEYRIFYHNGVPIPATYGGKPFRGIKIIVLGYTVDTTTAYAKEVYGFGFACVAGSTIAPLTQYLNKPDDVVGYIGLQDVNRLDAEMALKVPGYENVVWNNAVKNRFAGEGVPVASNIGGRGTQTYFVDNDILNQDAARNVVKAVYPDAVLYYPSIAFQISLADLADLGIVADDTTPPLISMKAAWVKSMMTQHTTGNIQIFFMLRYGSALDDTYKSSYDVLFNTGAGTAGWIGAGDSSWTHTVEAYEDTYKKGYAHKGIPLPATYDGKDFAGIVIMLLGYPTTIGAGIETTVGMTDVALIAGNSITPSTLYLNSPDDYPKVGNIRKNQLSTELQNQLVFKDASGATGNVITIQNSDKITMLGDSYTASHYTMKDKAYISRLSELTDWRLENFARSGDDYPEINHRIVNDTGEYHPTITFKEYGSTYAILISFTNDNKYRGSNLDYFFDNVRRIAETVMACGVKPILATEFVDGTSREIIGLSALANDLGIEFVDIVSNAQLFDNVRYNPFWGGGHPATRTNGLFYDPLLPYVNALPRPRQSIKIYRKRATFTVGNDNDLLYDNIRQRVAKWKELTIGHHSLISAQEPYYDTLTDIPTYHGGFSYVNNTSEYLKLQNNETVNFDDYALVEVIVPSTADRMSLLELTTGNTSLEIYTRNAIEPPTWNGYNKQQAFVVDAFPTVAAGDVYSIAGYNFTVLGTTTDPYGRKLVVASTWVWSDTSGGTLTKVSGTGPATFDCTARIAGFDLTYYDVLQPRGVWKQVTNDNGVATLDAAALQEAMQYDKVVFMLKNTAGFSLTDINATWYGIEGKDYRSHVNARPKPGTQLLTTTTFESTGNWTLEGGIAPLDADDGVLPLGTTKLIKINDTKKARQTFNFTADSRYTKELDIVVWARRYPAKFEPSNDEAAARIDYDANAPINSDTCDYRNMRIQLDLGSDYYAVKIDEMVGLHWKEVRVRLQVPNATISGSSLTLELSCPDDELELALAEVWQLD